MIAIPNIGKPQNCAECPISALSEFNGIVCKLNRNNDKSNCPFIDIVTCGKCKWSYTDERDGTLWCKVHMSHYRVNSDGFCNYGERRKDGI